MNYSNTRITSSLESIYDGYHILLEQKAPYRFFVTLTMGANKCKRWDFIERTKHLFNFLNNQLYSRSIKVRRENNDYIDGYIIYEISKGIYHCHILITEACVANVDHSEKKLLKVLSKRNKSGGAYLP